MTTEEMSVTVGSPQLGLASGDLTALDRSVAALNREQLALRTIHVLTGLHADIPNGMRNVSHSLAAGLGGANGAAIAAAMKKDNALFVEPMQQLVLLRRCFTVATDDPSPGWTDDALDRYFDACRWASDVCDSSIEDGGKAESTDLVKASLIVAASFLLRMSLLNPPHPTHWIARMRLMLRDLPQQDERAKLWVERLRQRIVDSFGMSFEAVGRFVAMLNLWSLRFKNVDEVFKPGAGIALDIGSWLSQTHIAKDELERFFSRTSRSTSEVLSDTQLGGPVSILPFRDRPFIRFADGGIAPIYPPLVAEKLTYDLFWWGATPDKKQDAPWSMDWGNLVELYVVRLLASIAEKTGCQFKSDIRWQSGQIDAAMWVKGHVALFEISAGMMTDAAAHSGDADKLREGLYQTLVRAKVTGKDKDKLEAVGQVARDAKALLAGELKEFIPVAKVTRVYPVVVAIDRRVRVPGLRFWFDEVFKQEISNQCSPEETSDISAVAVLALEDLETIEELVRVDHVDLHGTPRGMIRLLRLWELRREKLPKSGKRAATWRHFMHDLGAPGSNERLQAEADSWFQEMKALFKQSPDEGGMVDLGNG